MYYVFYVWLSVGLKEYWRLLRTTILKSTFFIWIFGYETTPGLHICCYQCGPRILWVGPLAGPADLRSWSYTLRADAVCPAAAASYRLQCCHRSSDLSRLLLVFTLYDVAIALSGCVRHFNSSHQKIRVLRNVNCRAKYRSNLGLQRRNKPI